MERGRNLERYKEKGRMKTTVWDGLSLEIIAFLAIKYGRDIVEPTYIRLLLVTETSFESKDVICVATKSHWHF